MAGNLFYEELQDMINNAIASAVTNAGNIAVNNAIDNLQSPRGERGAPAIRGEQESQDLLLLLLAPTVNGRLLSSVILILNLTNLTETVRL